MNGSATAAGRPGRRRPDWWPTWREVAVVLAAALAGALLGWATRPDRSIQRHEASAAPAVDPAGRTSAVSRLAPTPAAVPIALSMPVLGVFAATVEAIGLEADGSLSVPPADRVGWYRFGGWPGGDGSVVLAGHVAGDGRPGVFAGLAGMRPGDRIEIAGADGGVSAWVVTERVSFAKAQLPVGDLFRTGGPSQLVLITCGGAIDPVRGSYADNVVVLAAPVPM